MDYSSKYIALSNGRGFLMRKDRFNICISFYAVLAFVLAILGQTLLCGNVAWFCYCDSKG